MGDLIQQGQRFVVDPIWDASMKVASNVVQNYLAEKTGSKRAKSEQGARSKTTKRGFKRDGRSSTVVRKPRKRARKKMKTSLKKRVSALERETKLTEANKIVRENSFTQLSTDINACAYYWDLLWHASTIEAQINDLKMVNPADSSVDDVNIANLATNHKLNLKNIFFSMVVRNNGTIPVNVSVYSLKCKSDTALDPIQLMDAEDATMDVSTASTNSMMFPSDFSSLNDIYTILKTDKFRLRSGDEMKVVLTAKDYIYDPEGHDAKGSPTIRDGDLGFLVRLEGVLAHGSVTTGNVGRGDGAVDIERYRKFEVTYPSTAAFRYFEVAHNGSNLEDAGGNAVAGGATVEELKEDL